MQKETNKSSSCINNKGFTTIELIGLSLVILFFCLGYYFAGKVVGEQTSQTAIVLIFAGKVLAGIVSVLILVFSCIGIGTLMERKKTKKE